MKPAPWILPTIVISQFCCTSLWFAGNGVMDELVTTFALSPLALGHLTSAVQFGFIVGTLLFALLTIADRFSPSKVFFACALLAAAFNLATIGQWNSLGSLLFLRFMIGFFLAGIYPIGMKIAADYFDKRLGRSLGLLVGALVVGTSFPHFLNISVGSLNWQLVLQFVSGLAVLGGIMMLLLVPDGPYRKASQQLDLTAFFRVFRQPNFRAAAFGYFGHMWELYAFWAFVPVMLLSYATLHPGNDFNISLWSFAIIGIGGLACFLSGQLSLRLGPRRVALTALTLSGICCLVSPLLFWQPSGFLFIAFLLFWGMVVVADSPLFSTLVAQNAPPEHKGTALTVVNCLGFSITIFSIQLLNLLQAQVDPAWLYVLLAFGPLSGLGYNGWGKRGVVA